MKQAETELARLEKQAEKMLEEDGPEAPQLQDLYDVSTSS